MSSPLDGYAPVLTTATPEWLATEKPNALRRIKRSVTFALAVTVGLCFVGAALVLTATRSQSLGNESPAVAKQPQQSIIVRDEVGAEAVTIPVIVRDFDETHPDFEIRPWEKFSTFKGNQLESSKKHLEMTAYLFTEETSLCRASSLLINGTGIPQMSTDECQ
jgi:hypothetical protein